MSKEEAVAQEVENEVSEVTEAEEEVSAEVQPAQLKLEDLQALARIVEVAMQRGAFRANEASSVGHSYDRLIAFVAQSAKNASEAKAEEGAEAEAEAETGEE